MQKLNLLDNQSPDGELSVDSAVLVVDNNDSERTHNEYAVRTERSPQAESTMKQSQKKFFTFAFVAILLGVVTGFSGYQLYAKNVTTTSSTDTLSPIAEGTIKKGDTFGSDNETFKDTAKGYLEVGGSDGEGSHRLLRPGGANQTVHLTSSITDLGQFEGMEVEVWGETFQGQKVGWLMDVGRVKVLETNAEPPSEE